MLDFLLSDDEPTSVEMRVAVGLGHLEAELRLSGPDVDRVTQMASDLRRLGEFFAPLLGFGSPELVSAELTSAPSIFILESSPRQEDSVLTRLSAVAGFVDSTTVTVVSIRTFGLAERDHDSGKRMCGVHVAVHGDGLTARNVARVLAVEGWGSSELAVARSSGVVDRLMTVSLLQSAHLFSLPCRIIGVWPTEDVASSDRGVAVIAESVHCAVFGGSGFGKTTLQEHVIESIVNRDEAVAVLCMHGDLAWRAAAILSERSISFRAVDFADPLLSHPWMRRIIGHRGTNPLLASWNGDESMVVSLPASALGNEGAVAVANTLLASIVHQRLRGRGSRRLTVIIDEAHRFPSSVLERILAEGRKFGLRLIVVTQSPASLTPALRNAVMANCDVIATFRCGPGDAHLLDSHFPSIAAASLVRLAKFQLAVTDGENDFVSTTAPPLVDTTGVELRREHRAQTPPTPHDVSTRSGAGKQVDEQASFGDHQLRDGSAAAPAGFDDVLDALFGDQ